MKRFSYIAHSTFSQRQSLRFCDREHNIGAFILKLKQFANRVDFARSAFEKGLDMKFVFLVGMMCLFSCSETEQKKKNNIFNRPSDMGERNQRDSGKSVEDLAGERDQDSVSGDLSCGGKSACDGVCATTFCNGACRDLEQDANHCGRYANKCDSTCTLGACDAPPNLGTISRIVPATPIVLGRHVKPLLS